MTRLADLIHRRRAVLEDEPFDAVALVRLLEDDVFDREHAARFLGVTVASVEMAAWRQTLPSVLYKRLRLFTRCDLVDYKRRRGTGRASKLRPKPMWVVVGGQAVMVDAPPSRRHIGYGP